MQPDIQATVPSTELALVQHKVLRNTYLMLGLTMIPTVIGATVGTATNFTFLAQHPIAGPLLMLAAMFGLMFAVGATRNSIWGVVLLLAFTFVMGWWLGPMLQYALHFRNGGQLIGIAAGGTGVIFFTLAGIATFTRKDFSFMGKFLLVGLVLLFVASIANLFFQIPAASMTLSALIILLFSGYILYDVSQIIHGGETNYVMATLKIYLDIYNIFINLLNLLLAFSGQRD
ncbi:MAG TPA: Bax inhibitor-1/YccA family protein [Burkholderiales bacterium]|jgi:modulator of FtsH protease|nr:Bax inhibitor-1/YccA family protein [Burkholderiales bacterium]